MADTMTRYYVAPGYDFRTNGAINAIRHETQEAAEAAACKTSLIPAAEQNLVIVREFKEVVARVCIKSTIEVIAEPPHAK